MFIFTAIKTFFAGIPLKNLAIGAIGVLLLTNAITFAFMYKARYDGEQWKSKYTVLVETTKALADARIAENKRKAEYDAIAKEKADAEHLAELIKLKAESKKQRDILKSELEASRENLKLFTNKLNAAYDRVRIESNRATGRAEPTSEAEYTSATPELNGVITYGAALERNCAVTTADFNRCSQWVEDVCNNHKCLTE